MAEILEKLMLICLGLILFVIFVPILPLNSFSSQATSDTVIIDEDLKEFQTHIQNYENSTIKSRISYKFDYLGNIMVTFDKSRNDTVLWFRFSSINQNLNPYYRSIQISNSIQLNITSIYIQNYVLDYNAGKIIIEFN